MSMSRLDTMTIMMVLTRLVIGATFWYVVCYFVSKSNQTSKAIKEHGSVNAEMVKDIKDNASSTGGWAARLYWWRGKGYQRNNEV